MQVRKESTDPNDTTRLRFSKAPPCINTPAVAPLRQLGKFARGANIVVRASRAPRSRRRPISIGSNWLKSKRNGPKTKARLLGVRYKVGNLLSSDVFYHTDPAFNDGWYKMGVLGVEMEAAALYMNAAEAGRRALAICTVSDHILRGEALDADARQSTFTDMMTIALSVAVS